VVVVDVVAAVSVEVTADVLVIEAEAGERVHVGTLVALEGEVVTAQLSATVPVNEFDGVTVMVAVVLAPALTVTAPLLLSVKLVLPLPPGASQKSPHPASIGAAASKTQPNLPILIARSFSSTVSAECRSQGTSSARVASFNRKKKRSPAQ
jgi:uncharacterized membrane protein